LFERTSSLTKRILAMHPQHARFPRAQLALGTIVALAVTVLACEMPSPEAIAPDGKDVASKRLYGDMSKALAERNAQSAQTVAEMRGTIARYFPSIARGEGGPSILFVVRSSTGNVVLTQAQAAAFARMPAVAEDTMRMRVRDGGRGESAARVPLTAGVMIRSGEAAEKTTSEGSLREVRARARRPGGMMLPTGVGALLPGDIESVEITKHAAGAVAPNAVSIITIVLKPGAKVPTVAPTP
jgi:hypothetical protein